MRPVGYLLAALGCYLAVRSALLLAGRGRPRRGPTPALVIAGPYERVRNPLLGGVILALLGLTIAAGSALLLATTVLAAAAAHAWVVMVEEPALRERLGAAYAAYLAGVPRWIPRPKAPVD